MFEEFKYKTELHSHTKPASRCSEIFPERLVELYAQNDYTSIALTNHFMKYEDDTDNANGKIEAYLDDYYKTLEIGKEYGISVLLGAEVRFAGNCNDYLVYGISPDDLYTIHQMLDDGIDNFYKNFKNEKNIIIQAHPFRDNITLAAPESIDGVEVFNMHPGHNSKIAFAAKYARQHDFIAIAGTDYHHPGHECLCSILTKEPVTTSYLLADILKKKEYLIDIAGYKMTVQ